MLLEERNDPSKEVLLRLKTLTFCLRWAPSYSALTIFFFVVQNIVNVFQMSSYNEKSEQSPKSSHIYRIPGLAFCWWERRGWFWPQGSARSCSLSVCLSLSRRTWILWSLGSWDGEVQRSSFSSDCVPFGHKTGTERQKNSEKRRCKEHRKQRQCVYKGTKWYSGMNLILKSCGDNHHKAKSRKMTTTDYFQEVEFQVGSSGIESCCFLL